MKGWEVRDCKRQGGFCGRCVIVKGREVSGGGL